MSYLFKKKIIQKAYETAILWSKQKMLKLVDFYVFLKIFKLIIDVKTFLNCESSIFVLYEWKKTVSKIKVPAYVLAILNFFPNDQGFLPLLYLSVWLRHYFYVIFFIPALNQTWVMETPKIFKLATLP